MNEMGSGAGIEFKLPTLKPKFVNFTHTEYGKPKNILPSHVPEVTLEYNEKGLPKRAFSSETVYQLDSYEVEYPDIRSFASLQNSLKGTAVRMVEKVFGYKGESSRGAKELYRNLDKIETSAAKKLILMLKEKIFRRQLRSLNKMFSQQAKIDGDMDTENQVIKEVQAEADRVDVEDMEKEAGEEASQWIIDLEKKGYKVRVHSLALSEEGISFRRFIFGKNLDKSSADNRLWEVDRKVLETLLFMKKTLGIEKFPRVIDFFNFATPEEISLPDYKGSEMLDMLECGGFANRQQESAVVFERSKLIVDKRKLLSADVHAEVLTEKATESSAHEAVHLVDPYSDFKTLPQQEAFAVAVSYGFSFDSLKDYLLRGKFKYGRNIASSQMKRLLSADPGRDIPVVEVYALSASFFAYVFEKLGPEKFMQFYGVISGAKDPVLSKDGGKFIFEDHVEGRANRRGDVIKSLSAIHYGEKEFNPERFLEDYITEVNS